MQSAPDKEIFELSAGENRILIPADTDLGTLLALRQDKKPSVILFRRSSRKPADQAVFLIANLPNITGSPGTGQHYSPRR